MTRSYQSAAAPSPESDLDLPNGCAVAVCVVAVVGAFLILTAIAASLSQLFSP